jgi:hypothetical protein
METERAFHGVDLRVIPVVEWLLHWLCGFLHHRLLGAFTGREGY